MKRLATLTATAAFVLGFAAPSLAEDNSALVTAALAELAQRQADDARIAKSLDTFDILDFQVFSGQQRDRLHESHHQDIILHRPDGRATKGLDVHIEDLKTFFTFAPDTRIEEHPIRIG